MSALRQLRDHQQRAITGLRQSLLSGRKRPMLQMPTGAGKTLTSAHIVAGALGKGRRVAFCVPRKTLIDQTVREFEREGISAIGVMQAAHLRTDSRQPVQICSAQTLARRKRPDVDLVIVDEAHEQHRSILAWIAECPGIPFIGLSATPWARGLGKHYDDLLIPTTTRELIDADLLSDFVAYAPSDPDLSGVRTVAGDYDQDELADAMDTTEITADIVKTWLGRGDNRPTIAFCVNRRHAQHVCLRFREAGVAAEYIDGETPSGDDSYDPDPEGQTRRDMFARFKSGETKILVSIGVLTTGFDADVRCIIDAQPTRSRILFVQKIGRGLRTADGKDKLVILDHAGNHLRLGRVTDIHQTHLDDGKKREGSERKEKREPLPKICPECKAVLAYKARECAACGAQIIAITEVIEAEGELVELGSRRSGKRQIPAVDKEQFYAELKWVQSRKGYKSGWCWIQYRARFKGERSPGWFEMLTPRQPSLATMNWLKSRQIAFAKRRA
jgi:superfamily II DNA or RNA helicase